MMTGKSLRSVDFIRAFCYCFELRICIWHVYDITATKNWEFEEFISIYV